MTELVVPPVMPRWLTVVLGVAGTVIAVAGLRAAGDIIAPVFLALVLVIAVHPVVGWARRRGAPSWAAILLALLVLYAIVLGFVAALVLSLARLATLLPQYGAEIEDLLDGVRSLLATAGVGQDELAAAFRSVDAGALLGFVSGLVSGLLDTVSNLLFVLATVLFMGVDARDLPERLRAVPGASPNLATALDTFAQKTRSYLVVSTVFGLIVAAIDTVALVLLGIPLPLLWGLLSWITNYVPNIGFFLGLLPPALLGLLVDGPGLALQVVLVYCVANFVIQSVLQPAFVGDAVGLSVTVTFLSLVAWTWILGPLGALLAVPLSLLVKAVLLDADPEREWARTLVSAPPGSPTHKRRRRARAEAPPEDVPHQRDGHPLVDAASNTEEPAPER